jgi:hypothetical protein
MYYQSPTYNIDSKTWTTTDFETKLDAIAYVESKFKYPGQYNIKYSNGYWNEQAIHFQEHKHYPQFPAMSKDFKKHWNFEKEKCLFEGFLIYKSESENREWLVPSLYYWYLNYTPINDKIKKRFDFAEVWDSDLHYYIAMLLCILKGYHLVGLKKRQWGASLKNMSILMNRGWFTPAQKCKIFAEDKTHVENSWDFMDGYKDHVNKHCGWTRNLSPNTRLDWQIKTLMSDGTYKGNMSKYQGMSTEKQATKPVGGGISVLFGEEAGINSKLSKTHEYALPAVGIGAMTTGLLIYIGSVGELDRCKPLQEFIYKPEPDGFLSFDNVCNGDEELPNKVGFFAPEWWNYIYQDPETFNVIKCYDEWGNSDKEKALIVINKERILKKESSPEKYRMYCSQHPLCITEAFAYRKDSIFPQALLSRQEHRIQKGDYPYKTYDMERSADGTIRFIPAKFLPIDQFPYRPKTDEHPFGCVKVWEEPDVDDNGKVAWGTYFAGIDPISVDKSTTSDSLFSIYIYKNLVEITYLEDGKEKTKTEGDRIVAVYTGRQRDRDTTNEMGMMLLEKYNALAVVENNVDNFIRYAITQSKQKHLAIKSDLPFLKELSTNMTSFQEYGVRTNQTLWQHYINKMMEYIKEEMGVVHKNDGSLLKTTYGVERIPDIGLVKELMAFTDESGNYDRICSFALVVCLAKSRQANKLITRVSNIERNPKVDAERYRVDRSAFSKRHNNSSNSSGIRKSAFRNLK